MTNHKFAYKLLISIGLVLISSQRSLNAQIVIGKPNLGFSQACANESFNTYNTTFVFSPETSLDPSNQFSIELSDPNGDFSDATVVFTSGAGEITTSPATLSFSLPVTTAGENYKIRIKSSAPVATSSSSEAFAAYYKLHDEAFTINNLVATGAFCSGGSYLLTIDNPGTGANDSPLNYPSLTFNWFKETSPTTSVFVAEGNTLSVDQEGTYFVETNYGTCTSGSFSNRVTISAASSGDADAGISSSLGNPFCPNQGATTLTTIGGNSYQWFKDGSEISGATEQMYQTNEPGLYAVQVDLGECSVSGEIELLSEIFDGGLNIPEINYVEEGESLFVVVTTSATNPSYQWFRNDVLINDATQDSYEVTETGNYKIVVTENVGCNGSKEFLFQVIEPFPNVSDIPNVISPNGDGINDKWVIPQKYVNGTNTSVVIMNNLGKVVFQSDAYLNNWPENNLNVTSNNQVFYYMIMSNNETKKGSITVVR